jgi:hemerythrin superfamily protein
MVETAKKQKTNKQQTKNKVAAHTRQTIELLRTQTQKRKNRQHAIHNRKH